MKTPKRPDKYNAIWLSMPAYHDLTPKKNSDGELSQWNGMEMKEMSQYLLGVVTQSLQGGSSAQCPTFNWSIECKQELLEFYMYARYKSHEHAMLREMEDALHRFHTFKDVFVLGLAGKMVTATANPLRTELVKTRQVDYETNTEMLSPSKQQCEMNARSDYIIHVIDESKELESNSNIRRAT
jgi:hypothetical protein